MAVTLGQHYNVEEKPTVVLYTYINRHARTLNKRKEKQCRASLIRVVIIYDDSAIEPYNNRGL